VCNPARPRSDKQIRARQGFPERFLGKRQTLTKGSEVAMDNLQSRVWKQTNDITAIPQLAYQMAVVVICQSSNPSSTCREFLAQNTEKNLGRIISL
jgi:hypothetical protein